jgi:hypothetical protein
MSAGLLISGLQPGAEIAIRFRAGHRNGAVCERARRGRHTTRRHVARRHHTKSGAASQRHVWIGACRAIPRRPPAAR